MPVEYRLFQPYCFAYLFSESRSPALTSGPIAEYPLLASTTSGGFGPEAASFSVACRSVNDFATRLILMFGYFFSKFAFSVVIAAFWPPRTSWSQTVSVTVAFIAVCALVDVRAEPAVLASVSRAANDASATRAFGTLSRFMVPPLMPVGLSPGRARRGP